MIETKQLQYLVVCADLQSFSKAADVLYTSQPNVSKIIRTLEEELGFSLFERQSRGIRLTKKGKQAYDYACRAIEQVNQLAAYAGMDEGEELSIACNPSSWMSACFTEFYRSHKDENVLFQIMTASTEDVIRRCGSGLSDVGFVHMMEPQMVSFQYKLERNHL
ncbi:MAG: LysR family transcriptional regulator, partial [Lachnospiraceae bacterium]|nr:LysR family transcriptional regulator [Lachnospiraceae bacterium]